MARRELLTDDERRLIFGVPEGEAELIRHYTLSPADLDLSADRHGSRNRLGFAVQLCLLRHPGFGLRCQIASKRDPCFAPNADPSEGRPWLIHAGA